MIISIGDIAISLKGITEEKLPSDLRPYTVDSVKKIDATCEFSRDIKNIESSKTLYDSSFTWRVEKNGSFISICIYTGSAKKYCFQKLIFTDDYTKAVAFIDTAQLNYGDNLFPLRQPLLELWYSFLLMNNRGILVHGLGVKTDKGVNIFIGKSGAGKSTLGGIFAKEGVGEILSDDRLIIRKKEDGFYVYGTPWHGEARFATASYGKLDKIYHLEQSAYCETVLAKPSLSASTLFSCCFIAGWPRDETLKFVLDYCSDIAEQVDLYTLKFRPDTTSLIETGYL